MTPKGIQPRLIIIALTLMGTANAQAERNEKRVTVSGLMGFPAFDRQSPAGFKFGGWGVAAGFEYSPAHDIWLGGRFGFSQFSGAMSDFSLLTDNREQTGTLGFTGRYYHPQLTARWEFLPGWIVAPQLEFGVGYMFSNYSSGELLDDQNRIITNEIDTRVGGGVSLEGSLIVNVRVLDLLQIGSGISYLYVFDDLYPAALHVPLRVSFYWY